MCLMIKKKSLNFFTRFDRHLWLLQQFLCPTLKKHWLLTLELSEVQTGQFFDRCFGGDKAINENKFLFVLLTYPMLKNLSLKQIEVIFSKSLLLELYQKGYLYSWSISFKIQITVYLCFFICFSQCINFTARFFQMVSALL